MTSIYALSLAEALSIGTAGAPLADWSTDRPIEMVMAFAPGGGTDNMLRTLAPISRRI